MTDTSTLSGPRAGVFALYKVLIALFALAVVVQIFLAGLGVFGDEVAIASSDLEPHRTLGYLLTVPLALLLLVLAVIARPGRRIEPMTGALVVFGLVLLQLGRSGADLPLLGGLHAVLAFVQLGLAGSLVKLALDR
ncbi:MAG: hypothetical protein KY451_10795 [Actinobacteria bacterium]|nr:hypothetical protein [Actinomycetota bacterium]MBW3646546.1 hypothetical protein [Actinomycetota bacterium]